MSSRDWITLTRERIAGTRGIACLSSQKSVLPEGASFKSTVDWA